MVVNGGILFVCVVLLMAIEVPRAAAQMGQIPGTFLLCHCYFTFLSSSFFFALFFFVNIRTNMCVDDSLTLNLNH